MTPNSAKMRSFAPIVAKVGLCLYCIYTQKREKRRHESILSEELLKVISYLNQFLPKEYGIEYIGFDMARISKSKRANVLLRLEKIAEYCIKRTGFFRNSQSLHCNTARQHPRCRGFSQSQGSRLQRGVVRTNCVDCLDRTNTAQFAIGKCALAFQLYELGVIDSPVLEFDTDCVRMLEELYEDQGDTLALQYGGSQLVHRIKGYRKVAPWTSSSRDIMQTLSRYYSNTFSDADKQQAINLFLGVFEPIEGHPNIWELPTDFYLHNPITIYLNVPRINTNVYTQWWDSPVIKYLPAPYEEECKGQRSDQQVFFKTRQDDERVDEFWEYYRPYELTSFDDFFGLYVVNSVRDIMPKFASSPSPFAVRVRLGRRQEESGGAVREVNPNISGKDSTASTASTGSSEGSSSSSDSSDIEGDIEILTEDDASHGSSGSNYISLKDLFPTMGKTYGVEITEPEKHNITTYKRYSQIGRNASCDTQTKREHGMPVASKGTTLMHVSSFSLDSSYNVIPPQVNTKSREVYEKFVKRGHQGAEWPSKRDMKIYKQYTHAKYM